MHDIDQTDIAEKVYDAVSALCDTSPLAIPCEYEYLPADEEDLPCMAMQTITAANPVVREYLDGGYVAAYRFCIVLRMGAEDTRSRLDAVAILRELANAFCGCRLDLGDGFAVWSKNKDTIPCRIAAEDRYSDYQVTFAVQYRASR